MLKPRRTAVEIDTSNAATFGWLCVETISQQKVKIAYNMQPPSGGCVLKRLLSLKALKRWIAATFGWLCVETCLPERKRSNRNAATFGWLCVETRGQAHRTGLWLCSHLRVAVC